MSECKRATTQRNGPNEDKPIAIELCSGAGGMSLGFDRAGFQIKGAIDHDPIHVETYRRNFPTTRTIQHDINDVSGEKILDWFSNEYHEVDVVFGGPPCQGFSYIGRNRPSDPRNELLLQFARITIELRPRYIVVENVRGLLAKRHAHTLRKFVNVLRKVGYKFTDNPWVLDAQLFGVPQRRQRVFLIAALTPSKLPTPPRAVPQKPTVWDAISDLTVVDQNPDLLIGDVYVGSLGTASKYVEDLSRDYGSSLNIVTRTPMRLSGCRLSAHTEATRTRFSLTSEGDYESVSRFYRLAKNGVGPTLRAGSDRSNGSYTAPRPIHPTSNRCITVREAARLHSFPDEFQFNSTIWHGFRQIGNAVPPRLAEAVASRVLDLC